MLRYDNVQTRKRNANLVSNESLKPFVAKVVRMSWCVRFKETM